MSEPARAPVWGRPIAKLGAYGVLLALALGGGAVVGAAAGPIDVGGTDDHTTTHDPAPDPSQEDDVRSTLPAGGLLVSQDGYTFEPEARQLDSGRFAFEITGPDGVAVTDYEELHDRELHLIIASRDLREYAHLHPTRDGDGRWSVEVPAFPGGAYRAFADFRPSGGDQLTLGIDLLVEGQAPASEPLPRSGTDAVAGYEVALQADPAEGTATVTVRRDGEVVTTEPYLGAAGHLVALRDGDLAYLHVHPLDPPDDNGPSGPVAFAVEFPSHGTYALFFDFQVDGEVHTARFVVDADAVGGGHDDGGGGH